MTRRKIEYWVIPPQADAEFVAHMEQVLDTYAQAYDPACPVVCMDEQPVQLVRETRPPIAATRERPRRVDYEYERAGTASVFLFSEPLAGWRQATARARRTKADWALEVAGLLEGRYADCPQVTLVCDNLNTHTKGTFYEVFEPTRARELVRRIEFCYTPKHGSWLNIAENELSSLTRQCLHGRRIGDLGTLHDEVSAWSTHVNGTQRGVDWQMKVATMRAASSSPYIRRLYDVTDHSATRTAAERAQAPRPQLQPSACTSAILGAIQFGFDRHSRRGRHRRSSPCCRKSTRWPTETTGCAKELEEILDQDQDDDRHRDRASPERWPVS